LQKRATSSISAIAMKHILFLLGWLLIGIHIAACQTLPAISPSPATTTTQSTPGTTTVDWQDRLYTPTQITKIGDLYFIVDCWHNRVLYNRILEPDIAQWRVLDDNLAGPHSLDSDLQLYVVEDTGRHQLKVYRRTNDDAFELVQVIGDVGQRPHRVIYDTETAAFYVIASNSQQIVKLKRQGDQLFIEYIKDLPLLAGAYTRSMSIIDGYMYFVSGPGKVIKTRYIDDSYDVVATYTVPPMLHSMNDIFKIGDFYYLTATPQAIIRTRSLESMQNGEYENLYQTMSFNGTPYYITAFDGRYYIPQVTEYSGILSFTEQGGDIVDIQTLFDFGEPTEADIAEKNRLPK
jgi:hypothetical protein